MVNSSKSEADIIWQLLESVVDPEIPVLSIIDLGIIRNITVSNTRNIGKPAVTIEVTPTYNGCPAVDMINLQIRIALLENGYSDIHIEQVLSPAWTTDWMSAAGKEKLKAYGIAAPNKKILIPVDGVECPQCHSLQTRLISEFGSTACKALYQCNECLEPFDYFKCH
jgi:ring-1,2-phenylacetyl-CoA epoxidase subunit PaaD